MISVEDRLRAATRAAASTVADGSAPKLKLPAVRYRALARPRRLITWAAPLTAALAVVAVVIAAAVLHGSTTGPSSQRVPTAPPRYFVALAYTGQFPAGNVSILRTVAIVGNTATGRPIVTMTPPKPYDAFVRVTADASGTRYVLAAENLTRHDLKARFYELKITSRGPRTAAEMSPVLGPRAFSGSDAIALSPDGTRLAVTQELARVASAAVHVYDLATSNERTWVLPAGEGASVAAIATPSWEGNGRYLALDVSSVSRAGRKCVDCIRLLDTATAGGDILADSRLLVRSPKSDDFMYWTAALIAPDGRRMLRSAIVPIARNSNVDRPWIYVYNAGSGALVKSMTGGRGVHWTVLWSSADGRAFVVSVVREGDAYRLATALRFAGGRWHRVPLPPRTFAVAW